MNVSIPRPARGGSSRGHRASLPEPAAADPGHPPRPGTLRVLFAGCLVLAVLGCRDNEPPRPAELQRTDSAGVEVVVVPGRVLDDLPLRSLAPEPVLSIAGEQLEGFPLSRIAGALILPEEKVAIADRTLDRVVVVGFSGAVLHRFARRGEGPGEVGDVSGLRRRAEGELVIWDEHRGQLVVYDTAGTFRERIQTPPIRTAQRLLDFPGFLDDGSPVFQRRAVPTERVEGVHRPEFIVDRYRPDGAFDSALASIPGKEMVGFVSGRRSLRIGVELTGGPQLAVGGGRVFLGHGERFEIQTWSTAGLQRITRIHRARRPASRADKKAVRESLLARLERWPLGQGVRLSDSDVPVGDSFPAFEDLRADAGGRVWIRETHELQQGPPSWIILDRTGEPAARIHTPEGLDVVDLRGDLVLGVTRNEYDVPSVLLYRIERGTPDPPAPERYRT